MLKGVFITLLIVEGWWLLVIDTAAAAAAESLAVSSAKASQKALWVMKLSFLYTINVSKKLITCTSCNTNYTSCKIQSFHLWKRLADFCIV